MGKVTFILDTSADTLAAWLLANWRAPHGASETGSLQGQSLRESRQSSGARVLTADVIWVSHQHDEEGRAQAQPLREAFRFRLQPLAAQRVEVTAECLFHYGLLGELARLLEDIARRWPELRDTLEHSPDYWDFDSFPPENETQQTLLDAFTARLERLKERNVKPLALQGANACGAVFYLDNTTAREAATWLAENWRRRNYEPNVWTWTTDYHHARRYKTTPLQEATDGHGRALLTVGMVEWETHHPNPLSVLFGPLAIPQDQGFIVQDNPRGLEILLIQAGSDLVQVEARCNALLLLHSFTQLLRSAKTAYGDRLRNIAPTFGVMDAAPPRTHAMMDAYFTARADEFRDLVIAIEPKYARLLGGTARADGPAAATGTASEPASDAARADGPVVYSALAAIGRALGPALPAIAAAINGNEAERMGQQAGTPAAPSTGTASEPASDAARADGPAAKPRKRGRSKPVRQAKIRKLFEEENRRDLTIAQMARWYGVNRKTISRDLSELGYILEDGILKDNSPP